jgi:hypothetical protein
MGISQDRSGHQSGEQSQPHQQPTGWSARDEQAGSRQHREHSKQENQSNEDQLQGDDETDQQDESNQQSETDGSTPARDPETGQFISQDDS